MPIDGEIIKKMKDLFNFDEKKAEEDIKNNKHNKVTTSYYLLQKKTLRNGDRTIFDLHMFLQTNHKYKRSYGR